MSDLIETIRKVSESEVKKILTSELGVVTSVFPHTSDSDKDNYECNVRLRDKDVELRKVPVATPHIGLADIPHVGDLVILSFVNGDINAPIIIGRLYNDEDRPPTSQMEEIVYKPAYSKNPDLKRFYIHLPNDELIIEIHDDQISMHIGPTDITINGKGVAVDTGKDIKIMSGGELSIKAKTIKFESDQDTEFTASAKMTIKGSTVDINP